MSEYKSRMERRQKSLQNSGKKKKGLFKKIFLSALLVFLFMMLAGTIAVAVIISNAPALDPSKLKNVSATRIYGKDDSGKPVLLATIGSKNRVYAPIDKIPKVVQDAFISTEDTRFYQHFGIDPVRIGGAVVANITHGFGAEGASTLDQQLIKLSYLTPKKTLTRKIQEAYLAVKLDREYSKKQILEMYLNKIYFEEQAYGVAAAAKTYFGLDVDHLDQITLPQAAMLAAIPKSPAYYDPLKHPDNAKKRRDLVLDLMVKNHKITKEEAEKAKQVSIKEMLKNHKETQENENEHNSTAVITMLQKLYVDTGKIDSTQWSQGGLRIYTTINKKAQDTVEEILNNDANFNGVKANFQAGISIIDTKTGAILAVGGGRHYKYGTNYAITGDARTGYGNQVGSTAKPIIDYGPAIEYLKWPTNHTLVDEPHAYSDGRTVTNWDNRYYGKMTMKEALALSRNIPAIETLQTVDKQAGVDSVVDFANKLGIPIKRSAFNETYAIGSFVSNPLQMAGAYAAFGNDGNYNEPYAIEYIMYPDGRKVSFDHDEHPAMHDYTAYMITDMLKAVIDHGTYAGPSLSGYVVAGKSGSTNPDEYAQQRYHLTPYEMAHGILDSWFVGYTPDITAAVWTGYDANLNVKNKGYIMVSPYEQHISHQLFGQIIRRLASPSTPDWQQPNSVVRKGSALYVRGTQPAEEPQEKQQTKIEAPSGLSAKYNPADQSVTLSWNYSGSNVSFEVAQSFNGSFRPITTTHDHQVVVRQLTPGETYVFSVTAVEDGTDNRSDPVKVTIKIPGADSSGNANQGNGNNGSVNNGNGTDQNNGSGGTGTDNNGNGQSGNGAGNGNENNGNGNNNSNGQNSNGGATNNPGDQNGSGQTGSGQQNGNGGNKGRNNVREQDNGQSPGAQTAKPQKNSD